MGATWSVVNVSDGVARLEVAGEVDLVAEAPLVEEVDALVGDGPGLTVLLDLAAVEFIDSSGVRALVRMHQCHGDRVQLVAMSHPVKRVLEIAGLAHRLGPVDPGPEDGKVR